MRQENLVIIILVVAMAMVMGSTFAIVSTLSNYKPLQSKSAASVDSESQPATHESQRDSVPSRGVTHDQNNLAGSKGNSAVLSPAETKEVKRMLGELGFFGPNLVQSLKSFQQKNQISNSGMLDGLTLDSIINQLSLTKARSFRR